MVKTAVLFDQMAEFEAIHVGHFNVGDNQGGFIFNIDANAKLQKVLKFTLIFVLLTSVDLAVFTLIFIADLPFSCIKITCWGQFKDFL